MASPAAAEASKRTQFRLTPQGLRTRSPASQTQPWLQQTGGWRPPVRCLLRGAFALRNPPLRPSWRGSQHSALQAAAPPTATPLEPLVAKGAPVLLQLLPGMAQKGRGNGCLQSSVL